MIIRESPMLSAVVTKPVKSVKTTWNSVSYTHLTLPTIA